jgi:hypothetical protein
MVAYPHLLGEYGRLKKSFLHVLVDKSIQDRGKGDKALKKICNTHAMRMLLDYKWQEYAYNLLWLNILSFGSTALLFFHIALSLDKPDHELETWTLLEMKALMGVMGIYLFSEVWQMKDVGIVNYFLDPWNFLDMAIIGLISGIFYYREFVEVNHRPMTFAACTVILFYLRLLYYLQAFEGPGTFVRTVLYVGMDIVPFTGMLLIIILAFAHGFFLFFMNPDVQDTATSHVFSTYSWSLTTTYKMLLGDYHDEDLTEHNVSLTFFIVFTYVVAVVLLNLLIAKMNSSYSDIDREADKAHMAGRATMIVALEELWSAPPLNWVAGWTVMKKNKFLPWLTGTDDLDPAQDAQLKEVVRGTSGAKSGNLDYRFDDLRNKLEAQDQKLQMLLEKLGELPTTSGRKSEDKDLDSPGKVWNDPEQYIGTVAEVREETQLQEIESTISLNIMQALDEPLLTPFTGVKMKVDTMEAMIKRIGEAVNTIQNDNKKFQEDIKEDAARKREKKKYGLF